MTLKKEQKTLVNVLLLLLPLFGIYFSLQTRQVLLTGGARMFLAQGAGYPTTLATPLGHGPPAADAHGRPLWTGTLGLGLELTEILVKRPSGQVSVQKSNNFYLARSTKYF